MNPILEARQNYAAALAAEEALLTKLINENRSATDEEQAKLDSLAAEKKRNADFITRMEAVRAEKEAAANGEHRESSVKLAAPAHKIEVTREEHEDNEGRYLPFKGFGEQLQAVRNAAMPGQKVDPKLIEMNKRAAAGLNESVGSEGGYLVQVDFAELLQKSAIDTGLLASKCRRFPTSPGSTGVEFPVVAETSRVDGSRWGGVAVYWAKEAEAATKSKPKFTIERMTFQKLLGMCVCTDEMLNDAAFLGSYISQAFQEEFAYKIDDGIVRGTGAGEMKGILNSGSLVSVAKESSQVADTIVGMNVVKMRARLLPRSRKNFVWLVNADCDPQIQTLTITKDKSDVPLYAPANGLQQEVDKVLNREVIAIEQASTVGDQGDIIAADLSYYALITRDLKQASSIHVYFDTEQTAYRFSLRINGQPILNSAITPAHGSNTLSPFVTLDARA